VFVIFAEDLTLFFNNLWNAEPAKFSAIATQLCGVELMMPIVMFDISDLQFRLLMAEEQVILDKRRYNFAKTAETERQLKQEAAASQWSSTDVEINHT